MRLILGAVLVFSLWQSSMILFSATMLRLHGASGDESSVSQISLARKVDNRHPKVLSWLGRFDPVPADRLNAARALTEIEPFLGSGWANLFELKLVSLEFDGEAEFALAQAVELSPYDPVVQEQLVRAGIDEWLAMTPVMKRSLITVAGNMLDSNSGYRSGARRALLSNSGLLPLICQVTTNVICDST